MKKFNIYNIIILNLTISIAILGIGAFTVINMAKQKDMEQLKEYEAIIQRYENEKEQYKSLAEDLEDQVENLEEMITLLESDLQNVQVDLQKIDAGKR